MAEKDGTLFSEWVKGAHRSLEEWFRDRKEAAAAKHKPWEDEKRSAIERASRAAAFLESQVWKEDILPWLSNESAMAMTPWRPGEVQDSAEIERRRFYASGRATLAGDLAHRLSSWVKEGEEASAALVRESRRRQIQQQFERRVG